MLRNRIQGVGFFGEKTVFTGTWQPAISWCLTTRRSRSLTSGWPGTSAATTTSCRYTSSNYYVMQVHQQWLLRHAGTSAVTTTSCRYISSDYYVMQVPPVCVCAWGDINNSFLYLNFLEITMLGNISKDDLVCYIVIESSERRDWVQVWHHINQGICLAAIPAYIFWFKIALIITY